MSVLKKMIQLFSNLQKMDPALAQALANIRAGKGTASDANVVARGMYTDTMVPKMGNKLAYNDHLARHANDGYHVHVDMNDFGQINKFHGEKVGDQAIKSFGNAASEVSRLFGGKAYRNGGDEFKFWFHKPEAAHGFARELRSRLEKMPKAGGTHNLAASIGIGYNPDHAEGALLHAKHQLGTTDPNTGKRVNMHKVGNAPTVIHSLTHEAPPAGWKAPAGKAPVPAKATQPLAQPGLKFHNPLAKGVPSSVVRPIPSPEHPVFTGGKYAILTAENPVFPPTVSGGNPALEQELQRRGIHFEKVTGKYTDPKVTENSYLLHGVSPDDATDIGHRYGQESVIHSNHGEHKMIYTNGDKSDMYHAGSGHQIFDKEPDLFYSTLHHQGQPAHFSLNLDFDNLHGTPPVQQPAHEQKQAVPPTASAVS
jgi:GGDEF domain-containing protein